MLRHIMICGAAVLALSASGAGAQEMLDLETFDAIEASVGVDLEVEVGPAQSVSVQGADRDRFALDVRRGRLEIEPKSSMRNFDGVDFAVRITMPALTALEVSTGVQATVTGVDAERLEVEVSTGAEARLAGRCDRLEIEVSTGSKADANDLRCDHVIASANTGGDLRVHAARSIDASASLGGAIEVAGDPANRAVSTSLGGDVNF